jgi:hypothetical protein
MRFRKLRANEIEARVATVNASGCSLLLYKDARVDQKLLDETVGVFGWKRSHQLIGDRLYCTVEVWDGNKEQWISKQDVGTESYTEKEKGQASDSFKRACFNLGIGRELYSAPFIWIPSGICDIRNDNGRYTTKDRFEVQDIGYDEEGDINKLTIINAKSKNVVYTFGEATTEEEKMMKKADDRITKTMLTAVKASIKKNGFVEAKICEYFGISDLSEMTTMQMRTFNKMVEDSQKEKK